MAARKIKKEELLEKSAEIIRKKGYFGTSMDELAKACGLYKASFYYYYPSKEELVCAILAYYLEEIERQLSELFNRELCRPELKKQLLDLYLNWSGEGNKGHLFAIIGIETAQTSNELRVAIRQAYRLWLQYFTRILQGAYLEVEADAIANQMIIELEGAVTLSRIMGDLTYVQDTTSKITKRMR
ncbi:TetR/AcrR family transcriptional regulator [Roseivirga sp. BDSF3-8]|uniref:TetR/AcrR family transcriptional regulator n=1 Tax=Roseivirga sp. BDSF3-8 TaxID=3241598 RepID=UPI0035320263